MIGITTLLITTVAAFVLFVVLGLALGHRRDRIAADHYMKSLEEFKRANKEAETNGEPLFCASTKKPSENLYREVLTTTEVRESTRITDESNFALSVAVAAATDSTILGAAIGGDLTGAVIGDMLNDNDEEHRSDHGYSNDSDDYSDTSDYSSSDSSDYGSDSSSDSSSSDY